VTTMLRLQIALDTYDLPSALAPLATAVDQIDIIECGTILVLAEGMDAVRAIRAAYPDKTILADVRIAEAGAKIARMCFEAGADLVSCVAGALALLMGCALYFVHLGHGLFAADGGIEYPLVLLLSLLMIVIFGSGRASMDGVLSNVDA